MAKNKRFTIVSDDSSHKYVIPVEKMEEFEVWAENEDCDDCGRYDEYRLDGGTLTFTDPKIE
jgi:hypothetical protein